MDKDIYKKVLVSGYCFVGVFLGLILLILIITCRQAKERFKNIYFFLEQAIVQGCLMSDLEMVI